MPVSAQRTPGSVRGGFEHGPVVAQLPLVREPQVEFLGRCDGQVGEQLSEVKQRVDRMAAAGRGQAGQDGRRSSAARVADEEPVLPV